MLGPPAPFAGDRDFRPFAVSAPPKETTRDPSQRPTPFPRRPETAMTEERGALLRAEAVRKIYRTGAGEVVGAS